MYIDLTSSDKIIYQLQKTAILSLSIFILASSISYANATILFSGNSLTENGVEWCGEVFPQYKTLGLDWFLENYHYSIEARICANLYEDPLWLYDGNDRTMKLMERSTYYAELEIEESKMEAESGQVDPTPAKPKQNETEVETNEQPVTIPEESTMKCGEGTVFKDGVCVVEDLSELKGDCLIATATYGSELAPQVQFLREIRDNTLLQTKSGASFMTAFNTFYYSFSPTVAEWERQNPMFKEAVKITITPLISSLSLLQLVDIDTEQEMLGYGIGIMLLNVGMYFVAPAIVFYELKNKKRIFSIYTRSDKR